MTWLQPTERRDTGRADLTPDELDTINDVLDAAQAFADGALPFYEAAAIGTLADWRGVVSPAYTRYVAMTRTPKNDPRKGALLRLLDALVSAEGYVITRQGVYQRWEIRESDEQVAQVMAERPAA